jgi:multiple sugar transport system permease protein
MSASSTRSVGTVRARTRPRPAAAEKARTTEYDRRVKLFNRICLGVLIACAILWLLPLAWALDTALKPNAETTKVTWAIDQPTLSAFGRALRDTDMLSWYVSSFLTSALTALVTVVTGSMAAYALSRMRFRHKNLVFWFILIGIMIPGQVLIVPQFREFDSVNLLNTFWAVILPQAPTAIAVFIFKQFFDGLPRDLDDAAKVDGATHLTVYRTIVMPLSRPAVAAVGIFTFVTTWNNLLWPLLVLSNPKLMTVPVGLATVQGNFGIRYADTMATALLGALPLVAVYLLFQRHIVQGIAGTGLKG